MYVRLLEKFPLIVIVLTVLSYFSFVVVGPFLAAELGEWAVFVSMFFYWVWSIYSGLPIYRFLKRNFQL